MPNGIAATIERLHRDRTEDEQDANDEVEFTITRADGTVEERRKKRWEQLTQEVLDYASKRPRAHD